MGACACQNREQDNNEIISAKYNAKFGSNAEETFAETGDNFHSSKAHFVRGAEKANSSTETPGVNASNSEASQPQSAQNSNAANANLVAETPRGDNVNEETISKVQAGAPVSYKKESARVKYTSNTDYHDYSKAVFNLFNKVRQNPDKYEDTAKQNGVEGFSSVQDTPDYILWSEKEYDGVSQFAESLEDKAISTSELLNNLVSKVNEKAKNRYTILSVIGKFSHEEALWALLKSDTSVAKKVLTQNFSIATVNAFELDETSDRITLILANIGE